MNETEKEKTINIIKVRDDRKQLFIRIKEDKNGYDHRN